MDQNGPVRTCCNWLRRAMPSCANPDWATKVRRGKQCRNNVSILAEETNVWSAAQFIRPPDAQAAFSKVPQLRRAGGTSTESIEEQAEELLRSFFPPLPEEMDDELAQPGRASLKFPRLESHEIEAKIMAANAWKAPGTDGLPAMVWKQLWPVVREDVVELFRSSVATSCLPSQWRQAKIVPLRKPGKPDYALAKAWRPISLLSTLGKTLEAVIAERLSFLAEEHSLLPQNHFGARRRRSAEQALLMLQSRIYDAWRQKKVLSLLSFDVKGAYNGVAKERLLQRMRARRVPEEIVAWTGAFCSDRSASIVVNGREIESREIAAPGLPQGSPLSPILFLFYNADLVQRQITSSRGAMAFVDDYTVWTATNTIEQNYADLRGFIEEAEAWERRSGATFEGDKTAFIHFTRTPDRASDDGVLVKGQRVDPSQHIKLLGVIFDAQLRFREHVARAANRGTRAALALGRLTALLPSTARRLYTAAVAPVVDYGCAVWGGAASAALKALNVVQKIGAKTVTGAFRTVAWEVLEAEASLAPVRIRHLQRAARAWIDILTLPANHPLRANRLRDTLRFRSPLMRLKDAANGEQTDRIEIIRPYAIAPWRKRIELKQDSEKQGEGGDRLSGCRGIYIITATAQNEGWRGYGVSITPSGRPPTTWVRQHGSTEDSGAVETELAALAEALKVLQKVVSLSPGARRQTAKIASRNAGLLQILARPDRQSGQKALRSIYAAEKKLQTFNIELKMAQIEAEGEEAQLHRQLHNRIKKGTQKPTKQGTTTMTKAALLTKLRKELRQPWEISRSVGSSIRRIDVALPGPHTRVLYDQRPRKDAKVLAQMRTGANRLNGYLFKIGASETDVCGCGVTAETLKHFLFTCVRWTVERKEMLKKWPQKCGDLSFFLGGRRPGDDDDNWGPCLAAVDAAIAFARTTGRMEMELAP